ALGAAATFDARRNLSVSGTSQFNIDFTNEGFGGWLQLTGLDIADGSTKNFGRFDLIPGTGFTAEQFRTAFDLGNSTLPSSISMHFFGPAAEELAGSFEINTPDGFAIVGAALSVRD